MLFFFAPCVGKRLKWHQAKDGQQEQSQPILESLYTRLQGFLLGKETNTAHCCKAKSQFRSQNRNLKGEGGWVNKKDDECNEQEESLSCCTHSHQKYLTSQQCFS